MKLPLFLPLFALPLGAFAQKAAFPTPVTLTAIAGPAIPNYANSPNYNPFVPVVPEPVQTVGDKFAVGNVGKTTVAPRGGTGVAAPPKETRDELQKIFEAWAAQFSVDDKGNFAKRPSPVVSVPNEVIRKILAPDIYLFDDFQMTPLQADPNPMLKVGQHVLGMMVRDKDATVDDKIYPAFIQVAAKTIPTQDQFLTALKAGGTFEVEVQEERPLVNSFNVDAKSVLTVVKYTVSW
jgi:hypothetical protein